MANRAETLRRIYSETQLDAAILEHLANGPLNIYELSRLTGVKKGESPNPLASPLNQSLVRLNNTHQIRVTGWGQSTFQLP